MKGRGRLFTGAASGMPAIVFRGDADGTGDGNRLGGAPS